MSIKVVRPIIELELEHRCRNNSVDGGFDSFIIQNLDDLVTHTRADKYRRSFSKYRELDTDQRTMLVKHLLRAITQSKPTPTRTIVVDTSNRLRMIDLIISIPGIGKKTSNKLSTLGIISIRDALYHVPSRYIDLSAIKKIDELRAGETATVIAKARDLSFTRSPRSRITAIFSDDSGEMRVTYFNAPWIKGKIQIGKTYTISGTVNDFGGIQMVNPDLRMGIHKGLIIPVYPSTKDINQNIFHKLYEKLIMRIPQIGVGSLPRYVLEKEELMNLEKAFIGVHKPKSISHAYKSKNRLAIEELTLVQTALVRKRAEYKSQRGIAIPNANDSASLFMDSLPFKPTTAQSRCVSEISTDLSNPAPMNRLLHGDVGSGKTVVGLSGVKASMDNGYQVVWLSPTEVLARQTFKTACDFLHGEIHYLSGSTNKSKRKEIEMLLHSEHPCLIVGTHALLEDWVDVPRLGMVVVDEQHRFGVAQRARLSKKGNLPNVLVMSATPIPRTLSMTLYGDLDVSVIDEMPANRLPVKTKIFVREQRSTAYHSTIGEIKKGRQVYIVCPLVEESEKISAVSATETFDKLNESYFSDYRCALLHGRMKGTQKNRIMNEFKDGQTQILISTTVIEVGVDVPNATVMIIENAERFGLAQLHQLRGRVGRGLHQSYCFLLPSRPTKALSILEVTNNGLEIAEADLKLRGPGDIGGTMQSGVSLFNSKLLTPSNLFLLPKARQIAESIIDNDPKLNNKENRMIREMINQQYARRVGMAWVS